MQRQIRALVTSLAVSALALSLQVLPAQTQAGASPAPKPDLSGLWQSLNSANWDVQPHAAAIGRVAVLGAEDAEPQEQGIVEGGSIPYLPGALAKKKQNYEARVTADPELKCYLPGVPRIAYMPYPFQILQSRHQILIAYEFAGAVRSINMDKPSMPPADSWLGWSNGHWEGSTLVVDVTGLNGRSWLDRVGDYSSDALHVVERYTLTSPNVIQYEATLEDPSVYSRPWKIAFPLYRILDKNAQLLEFKCPEFAEELIYGPLRKK